MIVVLEVSEWVLLSVKSEYLNRVSVLAKAVDLFYEECRALGAPDWATTGHTRIDAIWGGPWSSLFVVELLALPI